MLGGLFCSRAAPSSGSAFGLVERLDDGVIGRGCRGAVVEGECPLTGFAAVHREVESEGAVALAVDGDEVKGSGIATLNLGTKVSAYDSIESVKLGETELGTSLSIDVSKIPATVYGEQTITVTVKKGEDTHVVTVPVFVVSKYIATEADLHEIKKIANAAQGGGYFKFTADVAITEQWWTAGSGKETDCYKYTIGVTDDKDWGRDSAFKGVIDGNGYAIKDFRLMCNDHTAFFIKNMNGATVKNLSFMNVKIGAHASLVGYGTGTIENVYVQLSRLTSNSAGTGNWAWGKESVFFGGGECGGDTVLKNITVDYSAPAVQADIATELGLSGVHCLFGRIHPKAKVESVVFLGVPAEYTYGMILGTVDGTLQNYTNNGVTIMTADGKVNGQEIAYKSLDLNASVAEGVMQYNANGYTVDFSDIVTGDVTAVYCDTKAVATAFNGKTATIDPTKFVTAYGEKVLTVVTENETTLVKVLMVTKSVATQDEFFAIGAMSEALQGGGYFVLTQDINLTKNVFYSTTDDRRIGANVAFTGTIDGQGYKVNAMKVGGTWTVNGWIQNIAGGTVKNLALTNMNMSGNGCIVGKGYGNFENMYLQYASLYNATTATPLDGNGGYSWFGNSTGGLIWNTDQNYPTVWSNIVFDYFATYDVMARMEEKRFTNVNIGVLGQTTNKVTYTNVAVVGLSKNFVTNKRLFNLTNDGSTQGVYVECGDADKTTNGVANNLANMNSEYFNYADGVISWKKPTPVLKTLQVVESVQDETVGAINSGKVKYMDQTTEGSNGTPVLVKTSDGKEGVYFSKSETSAGQHSEFRFTFAQAKTVKKITFQYKTTNSNTAKDSTDDATLIQVKQSDGTYVGILHNGLVADGEWHTAEIAYEGEITDLIIKLYQFQGEIVVANVVIS